MSVNQHCQQLQQDLQIELNTTNQLLYLISNELQQIKEFTSPGAKFESNIKENASTMDILGSLVVGKADIENIAPVRSKDMDISQESNQNISYE